MRNVLLGKSYTKRGGETSRRAFPKKSKFSISLDQQFEILHSLLLLYVQVEDYKFILKLKSCKPASASYKPFLRNKKRSGTSLSTSFSA